MGGSAGAGTDVATPLPPLPYRGRPPQVLLGVGAVLLVTAASALASTAGGLLAQVLLGIAALVAAVFSLRSTVGSLRSSAETLAACAAVLGLVGGLAPGPALDGEPVMAAVLAGAFLALRVVAPPVVTWPLAAWAAAQLAVLRALDQVPPDARTQLYLAVAVLGIAVAIAGRRLVARVVLVTSAPWWVAGVLGGSADAWTGSAAGRWTAAALMVAAGLVLVPARLRRELEPLLGPPAAAPVVAGVVSGAAVTGALSPGGSWTLLVVGYAGVLTATVLPLPLTGWRRGLFEPVAVAAGGTASGLCVVQLVAGDAWAELALLLLLTAVPTTLVALLRADTRPSTVPVAVLCLAGAALLALPAELLPAAVVAPLLSAVYVLAMALGSGLAAETRRATARAAAFTGAAAVVLPAAAGDRPVLAALLVVQGVATLWWAWRTGRRPDAVRRPADDEGTGIDEASAGWRIGSAQLVVAGWTFAALLDWRAVEAWTLPLAAGLLLAAGRRLVEGRSWPAYGPGLMVAAVPSTVIAVVDPTGARPLPVLAVAVVVLLIAARKGVLAPLLVAAGTAVAVALGLAAPALPWPLVAALVAGVLLLARGTRRERYPVGAFRLRLAQLR